MHTYIRCSRVLRSAVAAALSIPMATAAGAPQPRADSTARAQPADSSTLATIVARALVTSPRIRSARDRLGAARAAIAPAGTRPDPMLMAGIQNLMPSNPGARDPMTMRMLGVTQNFPYPGKLALSERAAAREADAARAELDAVRLSVVRDVRDAYYDLAYVDRALETVTRNRLVLLDIVSATETRYSVGSSGEQDVLRARVEAAKLGDEAATLREQRRTLVARLGALVGAPVDSLLAGPVHVPPRIARAGVADTPGRIGFVSPELGAPATGSPIPALDSIQALAARSSPELRAAAARVAASSARAELAGKARLPDFDVSVIYGQRSGFPDMVSASVSLPIPLQHARKQDQLAAAARATRSAEEADLTDRTNTLRAAVSRIYSDIERERTQLALYKKAILPQAQAAREAATAAFQVGRADLTALLDTQTTLFNYEIAYYRALSDFARSLAELDQVVGAEVLR